LHIFVKSESIDLRQTKTKVIILRIGLSSNTFHQRKCFFFLFFRFNRMLQRPGRAPTCCDQTTKL